MALTDEQKLLIGLARAYRESLSKFGQHDQPTYMQFPRIQGLRMNAAIRTIAEIDDPIRSIDIEAILKSFDAAIASPVPSDQSPAPSSSSR